MFKMKVEAVFNVDGKVVVAGTRINNSPISIWRKVEIVNPDGQCFRANIAKIEYISYILDAVCLYLDRDPLSQYSITSKEDVKPNAQVQELWWHWGR